MPSDQPARVIAIQDLPELENEIALFDISLDPSNLQISTDHIIVSLIVNR